MGSWAQLRVGDIEVAHFQGEIEGQISLVFTVENWSSRPASSDEAERHGEDEPWKIFELRAPVSVLRDRLEVTGADWSGAVDVFERIVAEKRDSCRDLIARIADEEIVRRLEQEIAYLTGLKLDAWVDALSSTPPDTESARRFDLGTRAWLLGLWEGNDIRICLRAVLECRPDDELVTIDATALIAGGWLSPGDDPREEALLQFGWAQTYASPIVVLTEGSSDARILETAFAVIYPHLRGFIRFPDFTQRPESSASSLVRTVKAFAAAGISNRVVAVFDADAAARDAVRGLALNTLPPSIRLCHLPPIELARAYPTVGPSGAVLADVNGNACSIEIYLGRDVLTDAAGELRPVRWGGYVDGVGAYQGAVEGKAEIQTAFFAKADLALADQTAAASQDWSDLRAILDKIRLAFVDEPSA